MKVSVIVPVMNETSALRTTVDVVVGENKPHLQEVLIVTSPRTTEESRKVASDLAARHPELVRVAQQERPFLGGALQDGFAWAKGSHVLMMAADLETDPHLVKTLIAKAEGGYDIVTATRWGRGGRFAQGYNPRHLAMNWAFQKLCRGLYGTELTDLTYGFRLFRREWTDTIAWKETKHRFLLETVLKPLRLGASVVEVPCVWRQRGEGETENNLWVKLAYVPVAVGTRFTPRAKLRRTAEVHA